MPIYEYQCERCAHRLETIQKISDDPLKDCPECNHPALKKLVSAASFRLKGGGWYETDFKTGDKKQLAESDSKVAKDSKKDADSKKAGGEAKPSKSDKSETKSADKPAKSESSGSANKQAG